MRFHPSMRKAAASRSMLVGVITKLFPTVGLASGRQTVRSLVSPPMRITPVAPSDRINPSSDALSAVK